MVRDQPFISGNPVTIVNVQDLSSTTISEGNNLNRNSTIVRDLFPANPVTFFVENLASNGFPRHTTRCKTNEMLASGADLTARNSDFRILINTMFPVPYRVRTYASKKYDCTASISNHFMIRGRRRTTSTPYLRLRHRQNYYDPTYSTQDHYFDACQTDLKITTRAPSYARYGPALYPKLVTPYFLA